MTVDQLRNEVAGHIQDPAKAIVNNQQLLDFLNSAARDAGNQGWVVILEESESLSLSASTYDYTVPASFAYIHEVYMANAAGDYPESALVPWNRWWLTLDGGNPTLRFSQDFFTITASRALKLVGHQRPNTYTEGTDTLDAGMESFLRERAVFYSARYAARGSSGVAQRYDNLVQEAWTTSEALLQFHPDLFRAKANSRVVPGR